tara:strand:- start:530 stop:847 length:318 start_codon:yes stop_codon:yes gene_type:complete
MQPQVLASMTPEERERWRQQLRGYAGLGIPSLTGAAALAAGGVGAAAATGGAVLGLIPNTMGNPEADPNWRNKLYPGVAGAQQAEDLQYDDTSIVGQMKRNAGYY